MYNPKAAGVCTIYRRNKRGALVPIEVVTPGELKVTKWRDFSVAKPAPARVWRPNK